MKNKYEICGFDTVCSEHAELLNHQILLDYNPACIIPFMLRFLRIPFYFLLFTSFLFLSCTPLAPTQTSLYIYRFAPPAFVEFSADFQPVHEIPFSVPPDCELLDVYPAPVGKYLLIE